MFDNDPNDYLYVSPGDEGKSMAAGVVVGVVAVLAVFVWMTVKMLDESPVLMAVLWGSVGLMGGVLSWRRRAQRKRFEKIAGSKTR